MCASSPVWPEAGLHRGVRPLIECRVYAGDGEVGTMKAMRLGLLVTVMLTMSTACATYGPSPSTTTTLMSGWEYHFSIDWTAAEQTQSSRKVSGYIYSNHGERATSLRVLALAIDPAGAVVGHRIAYVPGGVGGFGRRSEERRVGKEGRGRLGWEW